MWCLVQHNSTPPKRSTGSIKNYRLFKKVDSLVKTEKTDIGGAKSQVYRANRIKFQVKKAAQ